MGYLGKSPGIQTKEKHNLMFSNLVLKGDLGEAVGFFCEREKGGVLQPDELTEDCMDNISKTITSVLEGKKLHKIIPSCSTLEMYNKMPIFIPVSIKEDAVKSFMW